MRSRFQLLLLLALALGCSAVGCPCQPPNMPESIRWWLFSNFGASKVCPEMMKRGVPIKLQALGGSSIGRFFPQQCRVTVDDPSRTMQVYVTGTGYAMLPVTRRIGFQTSIAVEYRPDFRFVDDDTYVWGRFSRMITPPQIQLQGVENPVVNLATQTPLGDVATVIGQGVMTSEISKGFTVVRTPSGDDFTLGDLQPPDKPKRQFVAGHDHVILGTDLTEVRSASRDYLGPFTVEEKGAALYIKLRVTGAPLEFVVVDKATGDLWRQSYERAQPIGPPPGQPMAFGSAPVGDVNRVVPVNPGAYYLVVENRAPASIAPLGMQLPFEPIGYASYSVEVGDKP